MGGLAIRAWMRKHGIERAAVAITLGTPHAGTRIPQHMPSKNGTQMAWGSDWLKSLTESETDDTRSLFRIALTPQDNIVYPQRAQVLPGLEPVVFEGIGHVQMCIDGAVIDWVSRQLGAVDASAHV
jgi:triacylglycerol esterase/lipase EstA (alpha/beta hydrolase family)